MTNSNEIFRLILIREILINFFKSFYAMKYQVRKLLLYFKHDFKTSSFRKTFLLENYLAKENELCIFLDQ